MTAEPRSIGASNGLMRFATQPIIGYIRDPLNLPPLELHDDSEIEYHSPDLQQLPAQINHRNRSLQNLPEPVRPIQEGLFAFRQESLRGSRILHVASVQNLPHLARDPGRETPQNNGDNVVIQIENLDTQETRNGINGVNSHAEETTDRPSDNGRQDENNQHDMTTRTATQRVQIQFAFNIFLLICYLLGYFFVTGMISANIVFGVIFGLIVFSIIGPVRKRGIYSDFDVLDTIFSLSHLISLSVYIGVAFAKASGADIPLTQFSLVGVLVLFCTCCKNTADEPSASKAVLLILKIFLWIELFLIAIRVDGLEIAWGTVLIPVAILLILLAFSSFLIIFGSLLAFISIMRQEGASAQLIVGSLWYVMNAVYTAVWFSIVVGVIKKLDALDGDDDLLFSLKAGIIHSGVLFLFTLVLWKVLRKFQEFEVQSEMLVVDNEENQETNDQNNNQNNRTRFQVSKDDKTHLVMISPTFYTYLEKHLPRNNENNSSSIREKIEQAKAKRQHQQLRLSMPHHTDNVLPSHQYGLTPQNHAEGRNLDFSENDIKAQNGVALPVLKRGESQSTENSCVICFDSAPNAVLMDCGHGGVCYECALEIWKKSDNCIFCRQEINKILKIVSCKPLNVIKVVESTTKVAERG